MKNQLSLLCDVTRVACENLKHCLHGQVTDLVIHPIELDFHFVHFPIPQSGQTSRSATGTPVAQYYLSQMSQSRMYWALGP